MTKASKPGGPLFVPNPKARLFDQVREVMRFHHYALRTEEAYLQWIRRFLVFHRTRRAANSAAGGEQGSWRHPRDMGSAEVGAFLSHLAVAGDVAASTQNQALNALVFLYEQVVQKPLGELAEFARVDRPARLPTVLTQEETQGVLAALKPGLQGVQIDAQNRLSFTMELLGFRAFGPRILTGY